MIPLTSDSDGGSQMKGGHERAPTSQQSQGREGPFRNEMWAKCGQRKNRPACILQENAGPVL